MVLAMRYGARLRLLEVNYINKSEKQLKPRIVVLLLSITSYDVPVEIYCNSFEIRNDCDNLD